VLEQREIRSLILGKEGQIGDCCEGEGGPEKENNDYGGGLLEDRDYQNQKGNISYQVKNKRGEGDVRETCFYSSGKGGKIVGERSLK